MDSASSHPYVGDYSPLIHSLFPESEQTVEDSIPLYNVTSDWWVVRNNSFFNTQWIQCSYPISGSYGPTPRYLFYVLVLLALHKRRSAWIVTAALGSVMTYSATAAIHALVLVSIRTKLIPSDIADWMVVQVSGTSGPTGEFDGTGIDSLWLPVIPMAWDNDGDPVLAIVGTAFLVLLPMQIWSNTFKQSRTKSVLYLWSGTLLMGTLCALINAAYVDLAAFTQLRFCPPGMNDTIPLTNGGIDNVGMDWAHANDPYYWNTTVYNYFRNATTRNPNICLYPCFSTSWPLRDPTEITVQDNSTGSVADSNLGWWLFVAIYIAVSSSALSLLTIFAIEFARQPSTHFQSRARSSQLKIFSTIKKQFAGRAMRRVGTVWRDFFARGDRALAKVKMTAPTMNRLLVSVWNLYVLCIYLYAKYVSPVTVLLFVIWIEWYIWTNDPPAENFRHIGQWGAMVAAGVIVVGATVGFYFTTPEDPSATNSPPTEPVPIQLSSLNSGP